MKYEKNEEETDMEEVGQLNEEAPIQVEEVPDCLLCRRKGKPLYESLTDRMFDAPGAWGFLECPACGLVWLNPRPQPRELLKTYKTYYTHGQKLRLASCRQNLFHGLYAALPGFHGLAPGWIWKWAGKTMSWIPSWKEHAIIETMGLHASHGEKLLDVGCGDGGFLTTMSLAGWDVSGIEPDPIAARVAREKHPTSIIAHTLREANLADTSMDVVTMSHVIEHLPDPLQILRECRRILKPNGKLVVVTPNLGSQGHRIFRESWVPLEPPRHFYLFCCRTLSDCCRQAGFSVDSLRTSTRSATWVWAASKAIQRKGRFQREADFSWKLRFEGVCFQRREERARRNTPDAQAGEELALIARPNLYAPNQSPAI